MAVLLSVRLVILAALCQANTAIITDSHCSHVTCSDVGNWSLDGRAHPDYVFNVNDEQDKMEVTHLRCGLGCAEVMVSSNRDYLLIIISYNTVILIINLFNTRLA